MLSFARGPNHEAAIVDLNDTLRDFDRLLKQVAGRNCSVAFDLTAEPVEGVIVTVAV